MTKSKSREVKKTAIQLLRTPLSPITLNMLARRLRDKDDIIRKVAFIKLAKSNVTIEDFDSTELRMLIIKEGLTDSNEDVKDACLNFLKPSLKEDMSIYFKLIDCK
jgi:hypothetical protein